MCSRAHRMGHTNLHNTGKWDTYWWQGNVISPFRLPWAVFLLFIIQLRCCTITSTFSSVGKRKLTAQGLVNNPIFGVILALIGSGSKGRRRSRVSWCGHTANSHGRTVDLLPSLTNYFGMVNRATLCRSNRDWSTRWTEWTDQNEWETRRLTHFSGTWCNTCIQTCPSAENGGWAPYF